jgi:hypothetical protein
MVKNKGKMKYKSFTLAEAKKALTGVLLASQYMHSFKIQRNARHASSATIAVYMTCSREASL